MTNDYHLSQAVRFQYLADLLQKTIYNITILWFISYKDYNGWMSGDAPDGKRRHGWEEAPDGRAMFWCVMSSGGSGGEAPDERGRD